MKKIICLLLFFPILSCNNQEYRDLNKNGKLDIYEDKSQAVEDRVNDLISQMTIKEKAGSMFIDIVKVSFENESIKNTLPIPIPDAYEMMSNYSMNHIHIIDEYDPKKMLEWYNDIQKVALLKISDRKSLRVSVKTELIRSLNGFTNEFGTNCINGNLQ